MSGRQETTAQQTRIIPTWKECERAANSGTCTRLEKFIYDNEPAGQSAEEWRTALAMMLADPDGAIDT